MSKEKIVITGIGLLLPNTDNLETFWDNLSNGESQIKKLKRYEEENLEAYVAATIEDFDYKKYLPDLDEHFAGKYSREILIGMSAMENAKKDAGIKENVFAPKRIGIVDSSSRATLSWWYHKSMEQMKLHNRIELDSNDMVPCLNGTTATMYAIYSNIQGFVTSISNACVGGHHAIGLAMNELLLDREDAMIVCGDEFPIIPPLIRMYTAKKSHCYSVEKDVPETAMKPYDINRSGFALGEGAVSIVLEKESVAKARGAKIYCELLGHAEINEAHHATRMDLSGTPNAEMLKDLLSEINVDKKDISYYCAHGTSTKYNDLAECRILKQVYDEKDTIPPIGSVKPIYGHMFGAAGVLNIAASALMLKNQTIIPTFVKDVDPECDLDHVSEGKRETEVKNIVSFAHALGSQSSMVAVGRYK